MTIARLHTLHELSDLLAARDYTFKQIADAIAADPPGDVRWSADWAAFATSWRAYREVVREWVDGWHPLGADYTVVQTTDSLDLPNSAASPSDSDWWQRTLAAGWPLQDLYSRWTNLPGKSNAQIDFSKTPQPTALDSDLEAYKTADKLAAAVTPPGVKDNPYLPYEIGAAAALLLVVVVKLR